MFRLLQTSLVIFLTASLSDAQPGVSTKPKDTFTDKSGKSAGGNADVLAGYVKQLKEPDPQKRVKAVESIAALGEAGAEAAGPLCNATMDSSPKVAAAALHAIEKVRPDLHKPLTALLIDSSLANRLRAAKELGLMGEKAQPAISVMTTTLRTELAKGPDRSNGGRLTQLQTELFNGDPTD